VGAFLHAWFTRISTSPHGQACDNGSMRAALLVLTLCSACTLGGGPYVGARLGDPRGRSRVVGGFEVGAGVAYLQAALGGQSTGTVYGRLDLALNAVGFGSDEPSHAGGFRLGAGYGGGDGSGGGGVLALGGNYGFALQPDTSCSTATHVAIAGVELRYVGGWALMFVPRYEAHANFCSH
jgi:hypothetical protein